MPSQRKQMHFSQALLTEDQEMSQLEASVHGLIEEVFPPKVNWSKVELCIRKKR